MNDVRVGFGWESSKGLSDAALLDEVARVSRAHRGLTAELVAHLAEMDARKLYLREATPSMFVYCVKRLGFSEDEACRRIDAARMVQKWPTILRKIGSGELSLSVLGKLKACLRDDGRRDTRTDADVKELVEAVSGMSVRDAERVLAARFPKPDVPDSIRKLPNRNLPARAKQRSVVDAISSKQTNALASRGATGTNPLTETSRTTGMAAAIGSGTSTEMRAASGTTTTPETKSMIGAAAATETAATATESESASSTVAVAVTESATGTESASQSESAPNARVATGAGEGVATRPVDRGRFQPLSAERIQVKFTASRELVEKIALARDLMSHRNSRGDLATIFETTLDLWIKDALKQKLGVTERAQNAPRDTRRGEKPRKAKRDRVTNSTRREVLKRDGLGCTFVNDKGERCGARAFLELDHRKSKGKGGGPEPDNMRMLCRAHNQAEAERVYGTAHMERSRRRGRCEKTRDDGVRERTSTCEFVVGLVHPRQRGYSSSAGRSAPVLGSSVGGSTSGERKGERSPITRREHQRRSSKVALPDEQVPSTPSSAQGVVLTAVGADRIEREPWIVRLHQREESPPNQALLARGAGSDIEDVPRTPRVRGGEAVEVTKHEGDATVGRDGDVVQAVVEGVQVRSVVVGKPEFARDEISPARARDRRPCRRPSCSRTSSSWWRSARAW